MRSLEQTTMEFRKKIDRESMYQAISIDRNSVRFVKIDGTSSQGMMVWSRKALKEMGFVPDAESTPKKPMANGTCEYYFQDIKDPERYAYMVLHLKTDQVQVNFCEDDD